MAILSEVFEKVAAASPLDSEERILWLNFLNSVIAAKDKVTPMAQGQSIVTALSQITNNAGRLTRGEYISPADPNIPYPEDAGFTGVVQDSDGIRGINAGILQFQLDSADGKAYAGRGALEIDENGIRFPQRGSDGLIWGSLTPESGQYGASISAFNGLTLAMWRYAGGQMLSPTNFANGFTGWTNTIFEITTLPEISGNLAYHPGGQNNILSQGRLTLEGGNIYMFWGKIKSPYAAAYINIKLYDAPTGGTLIQTTTATMRPSDDFVTFNGFVQAPHDNSANYALFEIQMPAGAYASEFSFARVDGASVDMSIYGTYVSGDLVVNAGGNLVSDLITVRHGGLLLFRGTTYAYVWSEGGELYRGPNEDGTGKKRLLTTDDTPTTATVGALINGADAVTTPGDTDRFALAVSSVLKYVTWANIKATLKTYFDTLYNKYVHPNHTGDVTSVADGATTIANDAVTNAKAANMAANTIKGRITAGTGDPEDLTAAQVAGMLPYEWNTWTPTFTPFGSMTFTSVTVAYARYVTIGKICNFAIRATGTIGGTLSPYLYVSTPVTTKNLSSSAAAVASIFDTAGNSVGRGFVLLDGQNLIGVAKQVSGYDGNFSAGSTTILISGQFELP